MFSGEGGCPYFTFCMEGLGSLWGNIVLYSTQKWVVSNCGYGAVAIPEATEVMSSVLSVAVVETGLMTSVCF